MDVSKLVLSYQEFGTSEEFTNGDAVLTEKLVKLRQRQQLLGSSMFNERF